MAITISIAGTNRQANIQWPSFKISQQLTSQVDQCIFVYNKFGSRSWTPNEGDEVIVTDGATKMFAGYILMVNQIVELPGVVKYTVQCRDYIHLLDRDLVVESYEGQTPKAIVDDLIAKYAAGLGLTTTGMDTTPVISRVDFAYIPLHKCLQILAELTFKDWYVDYDKLIHLFDKTNNPSALTVTDTNGTLIKDTLTYKEDISNIKNIVYVRGGEYESLSTVSDKWTGETSKLIFNLGYKPKISGFTLTVAGVSKTVGIDGIDDPTTKDALIHQEYHTLKFPSAPSGAIVATYYPILPVIVQARDNPSIISYGPKGFEILDRSINSKQAAKDRAKAEINSFKDPIVEGTFESYTDGFVVGQLLTINSALAGLNSDFLIKSVEITLFEPTDQWKYKVGFVSTRQFGIIEFFQKLIRERGQVGFDEQAFTEKVRAEYEDIEISETVVYSTVGDYVLEEDIELSEAFAYAIDAPKQWVWGPYSPSSLADTKRPLFYDVDANWG